MQMTELTADEMQSLKEVKNGGLLMRKLPDDVTSRLIQLGLIEQKLGGLVITAKGQIAAAK